MCPCVCMFVHVCVYVFVHVYVYVLYSLLTNPAQPQTCSHKVTCQAAGRATWVLAPGASQGPGITSRLL